jgi:hypothetical protein
VLILGVTVMVAAVSTFVMLRRTLLTFEWDEWTILIGAQSGLSWLLQEHLGHFFPLGRAVYALAFNTFGFDYRGYVWLNLLLLFVSSLILTLAVNRLIRNLPLACCLGAMYLAAHGQYVNVTWALQVVWMLEAVFTAWLLFRATDVNAPILSVTNLALGMLVWLSFGSALIAVPFLVFAGRVLARRASATAIDKADVTGFLIWVIVAFGLVFLGRAIADQFPPPHVGAHSLPMQFEERWSRLPFVASDALHGYGFFATAPLVPGALASYGQRLGWDAANTWLSARPALLWAVVGTALAGIGYACWRTYFRRGTGPGIQAWVAISALSVGVPMALTALARAEMHGGGRTPRYDTFMLLPALLAISALLLPQDPLARTPPVRYRTWLRRVAASAIAVQLVWLLVQFPSNLKTVTGWRVRRAVAWQALAGGCVSPAATGPLTVPPELHPQLTPGQFCWIVARLGDNWPPWTYEP